MWFVNENIKTAHFHHLSGLLLIFSKFYSSLRLVYLRGSSNGRTPGSGPGNRGSSPCPRAMFYVYYLESLKNKKHYLGYTDDLKRRFNEHNAGMGGDFTSKNGPWEIVYYEACPNKKDAQEAERYYKTGQGRMIIKRKLKNYFKK